MTYPRFRVWLLDPDNIAVYENVIKCYETQIHGHLEEIIKMEEKTHASID